MQTVVLQLSQQHHIQHRTQHPPQDHTQHTLGYIEYSVSKLAGTVFIGYLHVDKEYRGRGLGSFLLWAFFADLRSYGRHIKEIHLDDCSDLALTNESIYYKFGFRVEDPDQPERMTIRFSDDTYTDVYMFLEYLQEKEGIKRVRIDKGDGNGDGNGDGDCDYEWKWERSVYDRNQRQVSTEDATLCLMRRLKMYRRKRAMLC
jgi:GNAT superfamily N-acetyltransferase